MNGASVNLWVARSQLVTHEHLQKSHDIRKHRVISQQG